MPEFRSKPISEHSEVPLADDGQWETIVDEWRAREALRLRQRTQETESTNASYVVSVGAVSDDHVRAAQLGEITSLVRSQGDRIAGEEICHLLDPNPRTLLGKGMAQEIAARARRAGATMLVLDAELTPSQARNLEDIAGIPIQDREAVILNVFLRHARTRRARIQVEVAQLEYLRPRIRGIGLDMDQQTGGMPYARGPGETASELLARKIDTRLEELKKQLRKLERSSRTQRQQREGAKRIALVGYTNAGKTSLMNALTKETLSARQMPFETLDTTSRCLTRHGGDVLVSDTVGFIRRLPERLLASFDSTLAEITEASLVVIVVDISDEEHDLHVRTTHELLERIGATDIPRFYVFNKADRLIGELRAHELYHLHEEHPHALLSSHDPAAVARLSAALVDSVRRDESELECFVPYSATDLQALVHRRCRVLESRATIKGLSLRLRGSGPVIAQVKRELSLLRKERRAQ